MRELLQRQVIRDKQQVQISKPQISLGYKNLIAWQKSDELAHQIYFVTQTFPKTEIFGLTSQLRRAALSVPANIVEGYARDNKNEFRRFLTIALGSLAEVEYFLDFSNKQKLIKQTDYSSILELKEECGRIMWSLYRSQK